MSLLIEKRKDKRGTERERERERERTHLSSESRGVHVEHVGEDATGRSSTPNIVPRARRETCDGHVGVSIGIGRDSGWIGHG